MITTREIWLTLSDADKKAKVVETLEQIHAIEQGKHPLSGKPEQGHLAGVKKDLSAFLINTAEWESNRQPQHK
jgi:hypothetical protein